MVLIKYFLNRELARKLEINLARWKRWSREFLPPDPLGGLQSGFARQYSPEDAFTVFLGGHLVSNLRYSIPEAKQILADLRGWLKSHGFFTLSEASGRGACEIRIAAKVHARKNGYHFVYRIREIISQEAVTVEGVPATACTYLEELLDPQPKTRGTVDIKSVRLLGITDIHRCFGRRLAG